MNKDWRKTASQFRGKARFAVSDNGPSLRNALLEKADEYQACVLHGIRM